MLDPRTVTPPPGHPLHGGKKDIPEVAHDRHPSDLDDVFPVVQCQLATGAEIAPDLEPVFTPFEPLANSNFAEDLDQKEAGGLRSEDDKEEKGACGENPVGGACVYEVKVNYITPAAIAPFRANVGGFAGPCTGQTGRPCFGAQHTQCHTFGSLFAASQFASEMKTLAGHMWDNGLYVLGQTDVLGVIGFVTSIEGNGPLGECDEAIDPNKTLGEITKPTPPA